MSTIAPSFSGDSRPGQNEVSVNHSDKPSQIKFRRPAQTEIFAKIVSFPPLNQLTVIAGGQGEVRSCNDSKTVLTLLRLE